MAVVQIQRGQVSSAVGPPVPRTAMKGRTELSVDTSLIVSLAALLVSVYTFWITRVAKFKLNVVATARVELTSNPQSPGAKQPGIIMQLLFSNKGAHLGYVHDVAVSICKAGSKSEPVLFRSLYEHIEESLNLTGKLPPPKLLAFTSFPVEPGETVVKKVVFVPIDSQVEDITPKICTSR
jgi:hypothetical protein